MFTLNPPYEMIKIKDVGTYERQVDYLVQQMKHAEKLGDVAVLFRNNLSVIELVNGFDQAGIPFYTRDSDNRFFSHWVVNDVLNLMRMSFTDKRVDIFEQIYTKINGYITRQQMMALQGINNNASVFDNLLKHITLQDYQHKIIKNNKAMFKKMSGMRPLQVMKMIRKELGYENSLERMCERLGFNLANLVVRLDILENIAKSLRTMEEFAQRLTYLQGMMKASQSKRDQNVVTFSTLHSAKGLEFEKVYMIDLIEGIIPSADDELDHMEESTRLFYVGMTRAKRQLELITYHRRGGQETNESIFVTDVRNIINPPKPIKKKRSANTHAKARKAKRNQTRTNPNTIKHAAHLKIGQILNHRSFGRGEVVQLTYNTVDIRFKIGTKRFQIDACIGMGLLERVGS